MNRRGFLKRFGIGAAALPVVALMPRVAEAPAETPNLVTRFPHRQISSGEVTMVDLTNKSITWTSTDDLYAMYWVDGESWHKVSHDGGFSWSEVTRASG